MCQSMSISNVCCLGSFKDAVKCFVSFVSNTYTVYVNWIAHTHSYIYIHSIYRYINSLLVNNTWLMFDWNYNEKTCIIAIYSPFCWLLTKWNERTTASLPGSYWIPSQTKPEFTAGSIPFFGALYIKYYGVGLHNSIQKCLWYLRPCIHWHMLERMPIHVHNRKHTEFVLSLCTLTAQNSPLFLGFNFNHLGLGAGSSAFFLATHPQIEETHGSTRCLPFIVLHSFPMLSLCLTGS
jgi:hypothetical protein